MSNLQPFSILPNTQVQTNITQGAYRAFFFDLKEFDLSRVEFNSVFYSEADPESELINGTYSFAYIRQDKLRTIHAYDKDGRLLPFANFLSRFNISIQSRNLFKTSKYLSRVFRQVKYGAFFKSLNVHINNSHDGKQTDGISLISLDLARALDWHDAKAGMSAQFTLFFERGLVKGHCFISDKISSDVIVYGMDNIKEELNLGGSIQYIALEPVKLGECLRLDIQTLLNLWNVFGPEQYLSWAHTAIEQYKEDLTSGKLSRYLDDFEDLAESEYEAQKWVLKKAVYHKVEYQRFPGLIRLGWTMLKNSIRTFADNKSRVPVFRIPVPDGKRGYLRPDLREHDEFGNFKPTVKRGTVELDKYGNLFVHPEDAPLMLKTLNGGDWDDMAGIIPVENGTAIIYRNPNMLGEVVLKDFLFSGQHVNSNNKMIGSLPPAPKFGDTEQSINEKLGDNKLFNQFMHRIQNNGVPTIEYNKANLIRALNRVLNNTASIGMAANSDMIRTSIGITNKKIHKQMLSKFQWSLEAIIDASVKDSQGAEKDMALIKDMYGFIIENNLEIPLSLVHRTPEYLQAEIKSAKAHPVDQLLQALNLLIENADSDMLGQGSANKGNRRPGRIDFCNVPLLEIGKVALENSLHDKAMNLLKIYSQQMAIMLEKTKECPDKEIQRKNGIRNIQFELLKRLSSSTPNERILIVNALSYQIYKSSASVHDSILWISDQQGIRGTAADTIDMLANLEEAYHVKVKFGVIMERFQEYRQVKPSAQFIRLWQKEEVTASVFADVFEVIIEDGFAMLGNKILKVGSEINLSNGIYKVKEIVQAVSKRDKRLLKNSLCVYIS